jgi:tetratricopeptide (TPR) repeat protein
VLPSHRIPAQEVFIGRRNILPDLVASIASTHAIAILGIAGVGKTALMARAASHFAANNVFWYEMRAGLVSLDDVLMQLARFLDGNGQFSGGLVSAIRDSRLTESDKIDLIITALNKGDYYLFFDSLHLIQDNAALNSLFSLLKEHLVNGAVFIASRARPTFYTPVDEAKQKVRVVELGGLSESEAQEFLEQKGVTLPPEAMEALAANFGGLPLALELIAALLVEGYEEARMSRLLNAAKEKTIDYLFDEVYAGLGPDERNLLTTSSLFTFSFSQHELLNAHRALFDQGGNHECLNKLKRQFLVKHVSSDQYEVHEVIRTLALENAGEDLAHLRVRLADYLLEHNPDDFGSRIEAALLYCKAEAFDQAAAEIGHLIEWALLPYYPNIAEALLRRVKTEAVGPEQRVWLLGAHGELAHHWRRHEEAEKFYRSMLALAEELQNKSAVAIALQRLGILYVDRDSELSEQHYLNSLALKKELEDLEGQAEIYNNLGLLYSTRGQFAEAKSTLEKGLELREQLNSPPWRRLPLYSNLGSLYGEQQQWEEATEYSEIAYQIAVEINSPYDIAKANYNLGKHEAEQGNHDAARRRYLSVLDIGEKYRLWELQEMAQTALGLLSWRQGNADEAIERFKAVAEIQERIEDKTKLVVTYFDIGTFYLQMGDHTSSLEYYEQGTSLFEHLATDKLVRDFLKNMYVLAKQSEHPRRMAGILKQLKARLLGRSPSYALARVYEVLGRIYLNLLDKSRVALACLHKEISILAQLNRAEEQAAALISLGVTYEKLGRFGEAVNATTACIELAETHNIPKHLDIAFYNRGNFHTKLEMWDEAEADFNRSLEIAEQNHDTQFKRFALHNLGELRRRQGRIEDALTLLQSSLSAWRELGDVDGEIKTLNNIGLAYGEMDDGEEALRHFNAALELSRKSFRKRDEANVLISLGNYHLREGSPENAKEYFELALDAARAAEDTDMEEGAMLSLAYAHRELGTVEAIEADFKTVAERAGTLKHYDNLISFLIFAGEASLDEREIESAAGMFEKALAVALNSAAGQLLRSVDKPSPFSKMTVVLVSMLKSLDRAAQARAIEEAQDFCKRLIDSLTDNDKWGRAGLWVADTYIKPMKDYFDELPDQSLPDYVFGGWRQRETETSPSDADGTG